MKGGGGLRRIAATLAALAVLLAMPTTAFAAPTFPALEGRRVVDEAGVLSPAVEASLTGKLESLEAATGRQLVIATLPSLQGYEIEDYGYRLGRHWGVGSKARDDGVLLIVAPRERKVRIEVGYGLEGTLTDALASIIIDTRILPKFRDGDLEGGVVDGSDAIVQQLSLPTDEALAVSMASLSSGPDGSGDRSAGGEVIWVVAGLIAVLFVVHDLMMGGEKRISRSIVRAVTRPPNRKERRRLEALARNPAQSDDEWGGHGSAGGAFSGGSGSGGGGGFSSGGGFSGGGGSFGGGGASGSW